ncbi:hypothetical protein AB0G02_37560 [Actinosynnema sp. NPDC023658]|uniref:hypothetical protein n=1 Tax=Actinosynnema sp. NPDC023658 TaxID=3155465 RepID=UPI0033F55352
MLFGPVADALPALRPDVDALLCHTDVEYALFAAVGTFRPPADLDGFGRDWGIPEHVVAAYRHFEDAHVRLAGDFVFAEPTTRLAEAHGRAFLARFTRPPAWHTADVPFSFGNLDGAEFLIGGPAGAAERALSRRMLRAWVDFCTTGDPGWTGVHHWGDEVPARREAWRGVDLPATLDHPVDPLR